jgi:hypothetical protein
MGEEREREFIRMNEERKNVHDKAKLLAVRTKSKSEIVFSAR